MAPEQAEGQVRAVGPAVDVWALGVIPSQLLAGQLPYRGSLLVQTPRMITDEEPPLLALLLGDVPPELAAICHDCLRKTIEDCPTAKQLAERLERFVRQPRHTPCAAVPLAPEFVPTRTLAPRRRWPIWLAAGACPAVVAALGIVQPVGYRQ